MRRRRATATSPVCGVCIRGTRFLRETPFAAASQVVLEQRGLPGNGWSSAWKAACWARLGNGDKAMENVRYAVGHYTTTSLFSICSNAMQVDGAFGMSAAIGEMLLQPDGGEIRFVPALPQSLASGSAKGLRARVDSRWTSGGKPEYWRRRPFCRAWGRPAGSGRRVRLLSRVGADPWWSHSPRPGLSSSRRNQVKPILWRWLDPAPADSAISCSRFEPARESPLGKREALHAQIDGPGHRGSTET